MIIIRNRLKYALTMSEANMICMQKLIKVRRFFRVPFAAF